jgi:hypothetical protein
MFKDLFSHVRTLYHKVKLPESLVKLIPTDSTQISGALPPALYNLPPALYDHLLAFKAQRGLLSEEMAVTVILEEYFGLLQIPVVSTPDTPVSRLEALEAKCSSLSETVAELQAAIATLQGSSSQPVSKSESPTVEQSSLPLNHAQTSTPVSTPVVDKSESLQLATATSSQVNKSEALDTTVASDLQAQPQSELIDREDIETELIPSTLEHKNLEQPGEKISEPSSSTTPMTQADLAKRLGVATSTIGRMQSKSNFLEWSQQRDPNSIAWVKSKETKLFHPQTRN